MASSPPLPSPALTALTDVWPAEDELSDRAFLDAAADDLRLRRLAEVAELRRAAAWAVRNGDSRHERDPMVTPGGDGTPSVREYALPELAMARETHAATARALTADALDLMHRLPQAAGRARRPRPCAPPSSPEQPAWAPDHLSDTASRLCALPARRLAALRGRGQLFVHVSDAALGSGQGVARIEGIGPIDVAQLAEVLGHCDVTVTPVLDLSGCPRTDAYEHPEPLKDHVWTLAGGDVFPFSPRTATRSVVDFDHTSPYDATGPPGQTGPHNSGPLRRRHHRWKTHGGFRCRVAGPGRHLWQTPNQLTLLVDRSGTRRLTDDEADVMLSAPEGVEMHLRRVPLSVEGYAA